MKEPKSCIVETSKRFGGGYIEKHVYEKPYDESLACIKKFKKDGTCESVKYFKDTAFKKLNSTEHRTYNPDGSYISKLVHAQQIESMVLSAIANLNKNDEIINGKFFSDKNFKKLFFTVEKSIYNSDGSFTLTIVYEDSNENGILSAILDNDKDDRFLGGKYFSDKNLSVLILTETRKYKEDGSYTITIISEEPNEDGDLSGIENHDKDDRCLDGKYYTDKNFSQLRLTETKKYNKDGSYIKTSVYEEPNEDGDLSVTESYNKDDRYLDGKYYTDKNFSQLRLTATRKYNEDGSYTKTLVYEETDKDGDLSVTENYNKDDIYLDGIIPTKISLN